MKRIIIATIFTSLFFIPSIYGQSKKTRDAYYFPRSEFYVQYGTPTLMELATLLNRPIYLEANTLGKVINHSFSGIPGFGYNFFIKQGLSIGIYGGYGHSSADMSVTKSSNSSLPLNRPLYNSDVHSVVGMINLNWSYYQGDSFDFSSGAYVGVNYRDEKIKKLIPNNLTPTSSTYTKLAYHITALRVRYGETFGVFAELGFGFRGLVNAGISVKF